MTKVMIVHSGSAFSTADCVTGLEVGLVANGCEVVTYPLHINLQMYSAFVDWAIDEDMTNVPIDPFKLAARGIGDMAIFHQPDAVIAVSGGNLHPMAPLTLRHLSEQRKASFPVALWCTESPYQMGQEVSTAQLYDVVFTNEKRAVPHFKNERTHYLAHAYNPKVHTVDGPHAPPTDVFFVGTGFDERRALFSSVDWTGINFLKLGYAWDGFAAEDTVNPKGVTANADAAAHYRSALISLNHHRTTDYVDGGHIAADMASSIGPRAYEIAACGGFQLMDDCRDEGKEVFGDSLATYRAGDADDLSKQIRWWLAHDSYREEWAAAQHAAILPHSWVARASEVLNILLT